MGSTGRATEARRLYGVLRKMQEDYEQHVRTYLDGRDELVKEMLDLIAMNPGEVAPLTPPELALVSGLSLRKARKVLRDIENIPDLETQLRI